MNKKFCLYSKENHYYLSNYELVNELLAEFNYRTKKKKRRIIPSC